MNIENIVRTTQSLYTCRIIYFDPDGFLIIQINQQIDFILQQYPIETASVVCLSEWHYYIPKESDACKRHVLLEIKSSKIIDKKTSKDLVLKSCSIALMS